MPDFRPQSTDDDLDSPGEIALASIWRMRSRVTENCRPTLYATKFVSEVAAHEARHGGERGSTRCELQKPAAGRVYGVPRLSR